MLYFLISGYARTGKDTFHRELKNGSLRFTQIDSFMSLIVKRTFSFFTKTNYYVYADSKDAFDLYLYKTMLSCPNRTQLSFAEPLKEEVHKQLNLVNVTDDMKVKMYTHPITGEMKTLRQFYIDRGSELRKIDVDYFIKAAVEKAQRSNTSIFQIYDVTDLRFPNELEFFQNHNHLSMNDTIDEHVSCRIFRSCVPIPDRNIESEHALDKSKTDLLIVTSFLDYLCAMWKFPQYRCYSVFGTLDTK